MKIRRLKPRGTDGIGYHSTGGSVKPPAPLRTDQLLIAESQRKALPVIVKGLAWALREMSKPQLKLFGAGALMALAQETNEPPLARRLRVTR